MPKEKTIKGQFARWAFTLNQMDDGPALDNEDVIKEFRQFLEDNMKHYIFQLEKETRFHYQGRVSFSTAKRLKECRKMFGDWAKGLRLSVESKEERSSFYCVKKNKTYVAGPWMDKVTTKEEEEKNFIPSHIRELKQLHPWQQYIVDNANVKDTRSINVIVDKQGNIGKSTLVTYVGVHKIGKKLPFCNNFKDIMRMAYCVGAYKLYVIDMPRAISKENLQQMYSAIEDLKNGYAFDDRYTFRDRYMEIPNIWVFTNKEPDQDMLSKDRWKFWRVDETMSLCPVTVTKDQATDGVTTL